jgi:hypothetical protein
MTLIDQLRTRCRAALAVGTLALTATSVVAMDNPERTWSHKDWNAAFEAGQCTIWTGGDGSGTIEIRFDMGGFNGDFSYLPIVYSNYPLPLQPDDEYELIIDGRISEFGYEMMFFDGPDAFDRYMVGASLTGGFVPDLVRAFRKGNAVAVQVGRFGETPFIADAFSLSGFTATYLKIAEWCHFDPDNLFQS